MSTVFGRFFQRNKGNIKLAGQFAGDVVVSFCFIHTVMDYGFTGTFCVGPSMSPTLESTGEFALIDRFSYKVLGREYMKGDVVISTSKSDPNKRVCKRVMGTENDIVFIPSMGRTMVVPSGHVWLEGDNPFNSSDSRSYGPVPLGLLQGRIMLAVSRKLNFHFMSERPSREDLEKEAARYEQREIGEAIEASRLARQRQQHQHDQQLVSSRGLDVFATRSPELRRILSNEEDVNDDTKDALFLLFGYFSDWSARQSPRIKDSSSSAGTEGQSREGEGRGAAVRRAAVKGPTSSGVAMAQAQAPVPVPVPDHESDPSSGGH